jgi:hypothetical protein
MSEAKSETSISEALGAIGSRIDNMTVAEIATETGKSERGIKTYLTRHGITTKDYDGAEKKAKAIKAVETSSPSDRAATPNLSNTYQAMASVEHDSSSRWTVLGWVFAIIWMGMTFWGFSAFGGGFFLFWLLLSFLFPAAYMMTAGSGDDAAKKQKLESLSAEDKKAYLQIEQNINERRNKIMAEFRHTSQFGDSNPNLVCPHCQTKGQVRSKAAEEVTSTKVVPVVGNTIKARKKVTQMHCDNCGTTWNV